MAQTCNSIGRDVPSASKTTPSQNSKERDAQREPLKDKTGKQTHQQLITKLARTPSEKDETQELARQTTSREGVLSPSTVRDYSRSQESPSDCEARLSLRKSAASHSPAPITSSTSVAAKCNDLSRQDLARPPPDKAEIPSITSTSSHFYSPISAGSGKNSSLVSAPGGISSSYSSQLTNVNPFSLSDIGSTSSFQHATSAPFRPLHGHLAALSSHLKPSMGRHHVDSSLLPCKDPLCLYCQLSLQSLSHLPSALCPPGCTLCLEKTSLMYASQMNAALVADSYHHLTQPPSSLFPPLSHSLMMSMSSPSDLALPFICSWPRGQDKCSKRFATYLELLQHLHVHASLCDQLTLPSGADLASAHHAFSPENVLGQSLHSLSSAGLLAANRHHPYKSLFHLSSPFSLYGGKSGSSLF